MKIFQGADNQAVMKRRGQLIPNRNVFSCRLNYPYSWYPVVSETVDCSIPAERLRRSCYHRRDAAMCNRDGIVRCFAGFRCSPLLAWKPMTPPPTCPILGFRSHRHRLSRFSRVFQLIDEWLSAAKYIISPIPKLWSDPTLSAKSRSHTHWL